MAPHTTLITLHLHLLFPSFILAQTATQVKQFCNPYPVDNTIFKLYSYKAYSIGWMDQGTKEHTIKGEVFIIDKYRFQIKNFTYDGEAPNTYVLGMKKGTKGIYSAGGYMLYLSGLDNSGRLTYSCTNLADPAYRFGNLSLIVSLPAGKYPDLTTRDIKAIAIYSYEFCVNFRSKEIPDILPGAKDPTKGEITPYCDIKETEHKEKVEKLNSECAKFPAICHSGAFPLCRKGYLRITVIMSLFMKYFLV